MAPNDRIGENCYFSDIPPENFILVIINWFYMYTHSLSENSQISSLDSNPMVSKLYPNSASKSSDNW